MPPKTRMPPEQVKEDLGDRKVDNSLQGPRVSSLDAAAGLVVERMVETIMRSSRSSGDLQRIAKAIPRSGNKGS